MKCQHKKGFYQQSAMRNNERSTSDISYLRMKSTAGIMAFGSYRKPRHPRLMPRVNDYHQQVQNRAYVKEQGPWACDHCQVATFATYEEAACHEATCPMNQNALSVQVQETPSSPSQVFSTHQFNRVSSSGSTQPMTLSLCMPCDEDCLSDRQCYVRSKFVELFAATESDVAARHSKGAQRLRVNQIGIRCKHCKSVRSKDRAERAMCYPSSISRIYQTVADMQRFHFGSCSAIPSEMKETYKDLKTTRPRGVGSPQTYWISSARELGLVDTENGIRYEPKSHSLPPLHYATRTVSSISSVSSCSTNTNQMNMSPGHGLLSQGQSSPKIMESSPHLSPLSPESQSSVHSMSQAQSECSDSDMASRDSEANMLLALKNTRTYIMRVTKDSEER